MNFDRFRQLWNALVTDKPRPDGGAPVPNGMQDETAAALIKYGEGDKTSIDQIKDFLAKKKAS